MSDFAEAVGDFDKCNRVGLRCIGGPRAFDGPIPVMRKSKGGALEETADYVVYPNSGFMIGAPARKAVECAKKIKPIEAQINIHELKAIK